MTYVITKWRPFPDCDQLPGIFLECTDPGRITHDLSMPWVAPEDNKIYATDGRICIRMDRDGFEHVLRMISHAEVKDRKHGKRPHDPDSIFRFGIDRIVGEARLPIVSNPCSEPPPCPHGGIECDCPACSDAFLMDEPEGGLPVGTMGHKMAHRYIYLLQYFGVRTVQIPGDRMTQPFRFWIGSIEGCVMGMTDLPR